MKNTEFDRMYNQKTNWEFVLVCVIGSIFLEVSVLILVGGLLLIPWPESMNTMNVFGLNLLIASSIFSLTVWIVGEKILGTIFNLSEFIFLLFKSQSWKRRYEELNRPC